jgi:hypothetical protein
MALTGSLLFGGTLNNLNAFNWKIIFDIALVIVILWGALRGARKGGIQSILGFASTLLSIIFAFVFFKKVAVLLEDWFSLKMALQGKLEKVFLKIKYFDIDVSQEGVMEVLKKTKLPSFLVEEIAKSISDKTVVAGTTLAMQAGGVVATFICKVIAWVALFFLIKLLLIILSKIVSRICMKIPLVGGVNVLFGVVVGTVKHLFIIYGALALLSLIPIEGITKFIDGTMITKAFFHDNLLMKWILS